jgi:hypothetical protein
LRRIANQAETVEEIEALQKPLQRGFNEIELSIAETLFCLRQQEVGPRIEYQSKEYESWHALFSKCRSGCAISEILEIAGEMRKRGFDSRLHRSRLVDAIQRGIRLPIFDEASMDFLEGFTATDSSDERQPRQESVNTIMNKIRRQIKNKKLHSYSLLDKPIVFIYRLKVKMKLHTLMIVNAYNEIDFLEGYRHHPYFRQGDPSSAFYVPSDDTYLGTTSTHIWTRIGYPNHFLRFLV